MKFKNKKNIIYYIMISIYTLGFLFFLFSPYIIIDNDEGLLFTEYNEEMELTYTNSHGETEIGTLEILEWTYSKKQNLMEIQMYIDLFVEFADETELTFTAQQKLNNRRKDIVPIEAEQVLKEDGYYIIQISDVVDFLNVTLMIEPYVDNSLLVSLGNQTNYESENNKKNDDIDNKTRLRTNYKKVTYVDEIVDKDTSNYAIERINWSIAKKESEIEDYKTENNKYTNEIKKYEEKIEEYRGRTKYLVSEELTDMQGKIESAESSINSLNNNIENNKQLIQELNDDIVMLKQKKKELEKNGNIYSN